MSFSPEADDAEAASPLREDEVLIVPDSGRLWPWAAALASAGLPFRVVETDGGRAFAVPFAVAEAVRLELTAYERVNRHWPYGLREVPHVEPVSRVALLVALLLSLAMIRFYLMTGPAVPESIAFELGSLRWSAVRAGEWWRVVTALTLHADAAHVLGNAAFCGVLGVAVSQFAGAGMAWLLILASGVVGNSLAMVVQDPGVASVGASTSAFGALGILAVFQSVRVWRRSGKAGMVLSRAWLPIVAATGLLAFLGTGRGADLGAHALGFAAGMGLAGALNPTGGKRPGPAMQIVSGGVAAAVLFVAWRCALLGR